MQIKMLERIQPHDNTSIDYACNTLAIVSAEKLCVPPYLPWAKAPNPALLLGHLAQQHMDVMSPYLRRMETEEITPKPRHDFVYLSAE
jgi:hypothetical protein